ncbi:hypothetical protein KY330_03800 [Candidatus Woesearchaeota archaeon]|nr:hypothetical protein [Candidatus Woesearchaeota archaeon]
MQNKIQCPKCGNASEFPATFGKKRELVARIEFLEQKVFELREENKDLRLLINRL